MAKLHHNILIFFHSLFCFPLIGITLATPKITIEGRVYCDTCRAGYETSLTKYIEGSKVKLECRNFESGEIEATMEGVTDATGTYKFDVKWNSEQDICEVELAESSDPACSEKPRGRERAWIVLSDESGLSSADAEAGVRYANPLGFLAGTPLQECSVILQKYALGDEEKDWII